MFLGPGRAVILSCGLSLLAPAVAAAQTIHGGVKGGIALSDLSNLREALDAPSDLDVNTRFGVAVGPFVSFEVNDHFAIQPELLFMTKGATATDGSGELRVKLNYLDIPVLAVIRPARNNPFYLFVGPSVNFNVSAKVEEANGTTNEEDIKDDVKDTEVGLVFGAGVSIRNFLVEGRYAAGLTNIVDDPDIDETVRNRGFTILVGVRF
jgi:hypothetical protein